MLSMLRCRGCVIRELAAYSTLRKSGITRYPGALIEALGGAVESFATDPFDHAALFEAPRDKPFVTYDSETAADQDVCAARQLAMHRRTQLLRTKRPGTMHVASQDQPAVRYALLMFRSTKTSRLVALPR